MQNYFSRNPKTQLAKTELDALTDTEWLVTNGLGGYASGTIGGTLTRVFHGYLIAALPSPMGRTMMLNDVFEDIILSDGRSIRLNGEQTAHGEYTGFSQYLTGFSLDRGLPVWEYEVDGMVLEKRIVLPHRQNTVYVNYRITAGSGSLMLHIRPAVNMRPHEAPVNTPLGTYKITVRDREYELQSSDNLLPPLRLFLQGNQSGFSIDCFTIEDFVYKIEKNRGYIHQGDLWSPGYFSVEISPGNNATMVASTQDWDVMSAMTSEQAWDAELERKRRLLMEAHPDACDNTCKDLVWAADQFLFTPVGRIADTTRARAAGDEIRSVIAGYHWFTDWGRDTMISLEGLTLMTGRHVEAGFIIRTFAHYIKNGLIPNMFPEGKADGLYHTADATLWFFHAVNRYLEATNDQQMMLHLIPKFLDIVGHHLRGTSFNIHVDPTDGLLVQGEEGYQLTWMDAKVDGWVVTPRRGKAVEINALWYNALCLLEGWLRRSDRNSEADGIATHAAKTKESFNRRFWNEKTGYLYDVVDGEDGTDDPACRPNQLFSFSLEHPILDESRWEQVLTIAKDRLLTPVGLRSLAPGEKDYKSKYDGDLRARDAAYHQGTVWGWLIGPFVDAWLRVHPEDFKTARSFLAGFQPHLQGACVSSISEIFDAEAPYTPRGCCAQAWSVAEVLRCFIKTAPAIAKNTKETPEMEGAYVH